MKNLAQKNYLLSFFALGTLSLLTLLPTSSIIAQETKIETPSTENLPNSETETKPETKLEKDYIKKVVDAELMTNLPDGKFHPERLISRAELATILVKAFYLDQRQAAKQEKAVIVPDVPNYHWAYQNIQTVLKTDIMKGYRGTMFFPNQKVTRAEGIAIFAQAYGVFQFPDATVNQILASYPDQDSIPKWSRKAIATIIAEGFINTDDNGNIKPLTPMTRGDMAYLLSKYLQRQQQQPLTPVVR